MLVGASVGWASLASLTARTAAAPIHSCRTASMASSVRRSFVGSGGGGARVLPVRHLSSSNALSASSHSRSGALWLLGTVAGGCSAAWAVLHATRQTRAACDGAPPGTTLRMALCQMSVTSDKLRNINSAKVSDATLPTIHGTCAGVNVAKMKCVHSTRILFMATIVHLLGPNPCLSSRRTLLSCVATMSYSHINHHERSLHYRLPCGRQRKVVRSWCHYQNAGIHRTYCPYTDSAFAHH